MSDYTLDIRNILIQTEILFRESSSLFTIQCLHPNHPDKKKRDMKIYKSSGIAHCFACKYDVHISQIAREHGAYYSRKNGKEYTPKTMKQQLDEFTGLRMPNGFTSFVDPIEELEITKDMLRIFNIGYCRYGFGDLASIIKCTDCLYNKWIDNRSSKCEFALGRMMTPITGSKKIYSIESRDLTKLAEKKVLYPVGSRVSYTIFNYDNLSRYSPLFVVEGIKSCMKIYKYINKNCTAIFSNSLKGTQGELIKEFKHVILIPDIGRAGEDTIQDFRKLGLNRLDIVKLPVVLLCKSCDYRFRGYKGDICPKCGLNDTNFCDAFDFEPKTIQNALGMRTSIRRRESLIKNKPILKNVVNLRSK